MVSVKEFFSASSPVSVVPFGSIRTQHAERLFGIHEEAVPRCSILHQHYYTVHSSAESEIQLVGVDLPDSLVTADSQIRPAAQQ